jgi:DNA-binding transcriptional ArsR family regulator
MPMIADVAVLSAIASPRRQEILRLVWNREVSAGEISRTMPDVTFGAVSLQLRRLAAAGLIESRPDKQQRFYRARREAFGPAAAVLEDMWDDALWKLKLAAELEQTRRGPRPRDHSVTKRRRKTSTKTSSRSSGLPSRRRRTVA